jgi:hypothetical protein
MSLKLNDILNNVNQKLAGELLSYDELKVHLDSVIDDINAKLSAKFPAFSEFNAATYPQFPQYDFFPDRFIRSVVCTGGAYYFYLTDEEGSTTAVEYQKLYNANLFLMQRDYTDRVPEIYKDYEQGYMVGPDANTSDDLAFKIWGDV